VDEPALRGGLRKECTTADLLLVVEVPTYLLTDEEPAAYERRKTNLILEAALLAEACGAKVLKLESPRSEADCSALTDALRVPWAVLYVSCFGPPRDAGASVGGPVRLRCRQRADSARRQ